MAIGTSFNANDFVARFTVKDCNANCQFARMNMVSEF
jgi:hypothetical protein